jgi:hypothetical protein
MVYGVNHGQKRPVQERKQRKREEKRERAKPRTRGTGEEGCRN